MPDTPDKASEAVEQLSKMVGNPDTDRWIFATIRGYVDALLRDRAAMREELDAYRKKEADYAEAQAHVKRLQTTLKRELNPLRAEVKNVRGRVSALEKIDAIKNKELARLRVTEQNLPLHATAADGNRRRWDGEMPWLVDGDKIEQAKVIQFDGEVWSAGWVGMLRQKFEKSHPTRELAEQAAKGESDG